MRVNIYAEEMPEQPRIEIIEKVIEGQTCGSPRRRICRATDRSPRHRARCTAARVTDDRSRILAGRLNQPL